ncbi:hypothetical protein NO758_02271 [Planktothrix agardhii]|nr:hypothetical protein NO758_02271 [Planktothrix agardhii]
MRRPCAKAQQQAQQRMAYRINIRRLNCLGFTAIIEQDFLLF